MTTIKGEIWFRLSVATKFGFSVTSRLIPGLCELSMQFPRSEWDR
jgi:hypothetical protein